MRPKLFTPGPTQIPDQVLKKCGEPLIHHRTDEFREVLRSVSENLKYIFQTKQPVLTLTSSGTGGMEAVFVNLFSPGETIITVNNGRFSQRWVEMPRTFEIKVIEIELEWGKAPDGGQVLDVLKEHPETKGVVLTQCETSTGTATDVREIANAIRNNSSAFVCVDGVSSLGAMEFRFDAWSIDACVSASQKGFMAPPGLAFVCLSERAIERMQLSRTPRFYFDLRKAIDANTSGDTPWTPAISIVMGLDIALRIMYKEGLENIWTRHHRLAEKVRHGIRGMELKLFSEYPSDSVTAVKLPDVLEWKEFHDVLKFQKGIQIAGGQGKLKGKIFRVGHIGNYSDNDIDYLLAGITNALKECTKLKIV